MVQRTTAERLVLLNQVGHTFHLSEPVFIDAGQTYWIDQETSELCVDRGDGRVSRHAGTKYR